MNMVVYDRSFAAFVVFFESGGMFGVFFMFMCVSDKNSFFMVYVIL